MNVGSQKGPFKHNFFRENQEMRSFYYYLGTGKTRESCWFRPLEEEVSIPLVDWNDESNYCDSESVHDETETE